MTPDIHMMQTAYVGGEQSGFGEFYHQWWPFVFASTGMRLRDRADAEDAAQAVFIRVWRDDAWRGLRCPRAYLRQAARWEATRIWRTAGDFVHLEDSVSRNLRSEQPGPEEVLIQLELRASFSRLIPGLPKRCGEVIALVLDGLSHREIAEELDISIAGVQKQVARGKRLLIGDVSTFGDGG